MAKISTSVDCSNAPKKELLRDFTAAFAESKGDFILDCMDDNIHWEMVGERVIVGKTEASDMLKGMLDDSTEELHIITIITHGDEGAVSGEMKFKDGKRFSFCDVYKFVSHAKDAKIKQIKSYVVELNS